MSIPTLAIVIGSVRPNRSAAYGGMDRRISKATRRRGRSRRLEAISIVVLCRAGIAAFCALAKNGEALAKENGCVRREYFYGCRI